MGCLLLFLSFSKASWGLPTSLPYSLILSCCVLVLRCRHNQFCMIFWRLISFNCL
ncbi:unnamed protein product [Schistosoma mansoni]|uniref:Smp_204790 n=1 Tax=Schistosoma mansoni TaxID=6183 RepID=UPI00022C815A|nr:unnamed protein product [Schistosoma mansoni]|eukprot:XP_018646669.1 unnamed protein product [Schistosoma mansoni]